MEEIAHIQIKVRLRDRCCLAGTDMLTPEVLPFSLRGSAYS